MYPGRRAALYRSGTSALFSLLCALKERSRRPFILMSAYTCPDLAAAAVRAGFRVALADVFPDSVAMNPDTLPVLPDECAAMVVSNLYGLPEDLSRWAEVAERSGAVLVDDACQSALSIDSAGRVGARRNAVGLVSFGRGKALSAAGGGALLLPPGFDECGSDEDAGAFAGAGETFYAFALSILGRPELYWIPQRLPFLGLGETVYDPEFSVRGRSSAAWLFALARLESLESFRDELIAGAASWKNSLPGSPALAERAHPSASAVLVRYPLLCRDGAAKARLSAGPAASLGISGSYPRTLDEFAGLRPSVVYKDLSAAKALAERIVTLPVHRFVNDDDRRRAAAILSEAQ